MSDANQPNTGSARLLVVIVNYKTASLTIDCLRSKAPEVRSLQNALVAVADNASGDGSAEQIAAPIASEAWNDWASFTPLDRNGGFAFGNNALIHQALGEPNPPRLDPPPQPRHCSSPRRSESTGGLHGLPPQRRHRRQPLGRSRRYSPAVSVSVSHPSQRVRFRLAARTNIKTTSKVGLSASSPPRNLPNRLGSRGQRDRPPPSI